MAAASSTTAAHVLPQHKYDAFLSFRGEDTRVKFCSHLYAALKEKKVLTYMDDKSLERGDELGPALLSAIEQSKLSIIIFSVNYASSRWCLDELVHILKCKEAHGQLVLPVFYDVDPSHVRRQEATYADAFAILEERFKDNMDRVHTWREALTRAADLSGFHSQSPNFRNENELVETIVEDILMKLNRKLSYVVKGLVGMERHIEQLELLLCIPAEDVSFRTVGIWGMGGCGKTTLADVVYHRNSSEFHACVFLANVREESEKHGIYHLRNELFRQLLKEKHFCIGSPSIGPIYNIDRLSRTKVLVVLDDVSDLSQLEFLLEDQVQFDPGSRIIITTRNRRVLKKRVHEDHIYEVNKLSKKKALQLFQSIALIKDDFSIEGYSNLSEKVVDYAGCNPLALKVLASRFLHCKSKIVWEEELKKLKTFPDKKVQNVLRLSYNELEDNEKGIFLNIACFLKGDNRCDAERKLEMHGFSPLSGIEILIDMSLISIVHNRVEMHDLLQEMGRAIEGGIEELGKRKRLWNAEDSYQVLRNKSGTSSAEAMYLDMTKIRELQLSPTAFMKLQNLKLLKLYVPQHVHEEHKRQKRCTVEEKQLSSFSWRPIVKAFHYFLAKSRIWGDSHDKVCNYHYEVYKKYCKVHFPKGLEFLPEGLRYLYWDGYPWKSLPSKYFPKNLVEIHMPRSQVKQLWNNAQNLGSLKCLNLSHSKQLTEVPDLTGSPYIERIDLSWCRRLVQVPSYFQNLENLTYLDLGGCWNLKTFGEIPCNLEFLSLSNSRIEEISPSICSHEKLQTLKLEFCSNLKNLPIASNNNSCKLNVYGCDQNRSALKHLEMWGSKVESIPDCIYNLHQLESLNLSLCSNLKRLPYSSSAVGRLCSLKTLRLSYCRELEIPDSLICLSTLQKIDLRRTMIENIPTSIKYVSGLHKLNLSECHKLQCLPELPSRLIELDVSGCTSLNSVASSRSALMQPCQGLDLFERIRFTNCCELDATARNNIMGDAQLRSMRMSTLNHVRRRRSLMVDCPGNEIPRWFRYEREGCEINVQFPHDLVHHINRTTDEYSWLGFAAVIANSECAFPHHVRGWGFNLVCKCSFKTNNDDDGEGYQYAQFRSVYIWRNESGLRLEEDHVVVFVEPWRRGIRRRRSNAIIPFDKLTEASFRFYPVCYTYSQHGEREELGFLIKVVKCGIHML